MEFATLTVRPLPLLVPEGVFDAFGWCKPSTLRVGMPRGGMPSHPLPGSENPAGLMFVMHASCNLPKELANLHVPSIDVGEAWGLAPWAIDDATDGLYAERTAPMDVLWLAAESWAALHWGLHDWAHFQSHGPFDQRAWTELQCDASALVWSLANEAPLGLEHRTWQEMRANVAEVARDRFRSEGLPFDAAWLDESRLAELAAFRTDESR